MIIKEYEYNKSIEEFILNEQAKYEQKNGIVCNYKPFCFIAYENNEIVGLIAGSTYYSEVNIEELVVLEEHRGKKIGTKLIKTLEDIYKDKGYNNINAWTDEFQAPSFYEKMGFQLEYVRKDKNNSKLNKYFFVKFFK